MVVSEINSSNNDFLQNWIAENSENIEKAVSAMQNLVSLYSMSSDVPPQQENNEEVDTAAQNQQKTDIYKLDVTLYTDLTPITDTMSKGRVRIFYTGLNRNRTYISEEFANQLIESLPYTPVKGIFDKDEMDFTDHGEKNSDGKIYGIVMADPNFAWEEHLDEDGVIRTYACADVLYYTALYPEATLIPGDSESMEIYQGTLKGEWKTWEDGLPYYHFYSGCLLGLQILGMSTEPCFEGAAFYSLKEDLQYLVNYVKNINEKEADAPVERTLFRLSDSEKAEQISMALNPNFNESGNWEMSAIVLDVYEDYALIGDMATGGYKRAYYSKEGDSITLGDIVDVKIVDVSETEYAALEAMKAAAGTYEVALENNNKVADYDEVKSNYAAAQETITSLESKVSEFSAQEEAKNSEIETLKEAQTNFEAQISRLNQEKEDLTNENKALSEFKANIEMSKKQEILTSFAEHLTDELLESFKEKMEDYSVSDFKKEVCTAAYDNDTTLFSKKDSMEIYPKLDAYEKSSLSPVERLLENHKKGGK